MQRPMINDFVSMMPHDILQKPISEHFEEIEEHPIVTFGENENEISSFHIIEQKDHLKKSKQNYSYLTRWHPAIDW